MNATENRRQIARHRNMLHDLEVTVAELEARRADLLASRPEDNDYRPAAERAREELSEVEAELAAARVERARLADGVAELTSRLPNAAEIAAAETQAAELAERAAEAAGEALDAWTIVAAGLADLVEAAGRYGEASRARDTAGGARRTIAEQYGIDLPALTLEAISAEEVRAALTLLTGAQQAVRGGGVPLVAGNALEELLTPLRERLELADPEAEDPAAPELPFTPGGEDDPLREYVVAREPVEAPA